MLLNLVTTKDMKALEDYYNERGLSYSAMMDNAGIKAANNIVELAFKEHIENPKIVFIAGMGNNAGDAFVSAKHLTEYNFDVTVYLCDSSKKMKTELAKTNFDIIQNDSRICLAFDKDEDFTNLETLVRTSDFIVDAVFGTGFHGEFNEHDKKMFQVINKNKYCGQKYFIAYDIPSGGNGTNGSAVSDTFNADYTYTFGFQKTGLYQYPLKEFCGKIFSVDIGFFDYNWSEALKNATYLSAYYLELDTLIFPERKATSNKGNFGKLLCITGSETMPGASIMSTKSALRSGIGLITVATASLNVPSLATVCNEATFVKLDTDDEGFILFNDKNKEKLLQKLSVSTSVLIGCGLGVTYNTKQLVKWVIENATCPVVVDADGLKCIADNLDITNNAKFPVILTPHPGEMSYLTGREIKYIQENRIDVSREFVTQHKNIILVLKGAGTITSKFDSKTDKTEMYINMTGNPGMSCGGSGDVLAGIVASIIARTKTSYLTDTAISVWIHGKAGDFAKEKYSEISMLPTDIINELPNVYKSLS